MGKLDKAVEAYYESVGPQGVPTGFKEARGEMFLFLERHLSRE